jgi:hypothetical protein
MKSEIRKDGIGISGSYGGTNPACLPRYGLAATEDAVTRNTCASHRLRIPVRAIFLGKDHR